MSACRSFGEGRAALRYGAFILKLEYLDIPFIPSLFPWGKRRGRLIIFLFVQDSGADIDIVGSGENGKDDNPVNSKV